MWYCCHYFFITTKWVAGNSFLCICDGTNQKYRFSPHYLHWRRFFCSQCGQEKQLQRPKTVSCVCGSACIVLTWTWKIENLPFKCLQPKMRKLKATMWKAFLNILHALLWLALNSASGWCYQRLHRINQAECRQIEFEAMYRIHSNYWIIFNANKSLHHMTRRGGNLRKQKTYWGFDLANKFTFSHLFQNLILITQGKPQTDNYNTVYAENKF